jgi:hypothetical protein
MSKVKDKLKELEERLDNISFIQSEILRILGYRIKCRTPYEMHRLYLEKTEEEE